jgi:hypothetical protein
MSALDVLTRKDRARPLDCILFVKNLTGFLVGRTPRRPTQSASTSRFAQKLIIWNALKSCPSGYIFNAAEARAQGHGIFSQTGYLEAYVNLASALGELGTPRRSQRSRPRGS